MSLIRKFFKQAFKRKPSEDKLYFEEWVDRFKTGTAWNRMDNRCRKIWEKVAKKYKFLAGTD